MKRSRSSAVAAFAMTVSVLWPRQVLSHETLTTTVPVRPRNRADPEQALRDVSRGERAVVSARDLRAHLAARAEDPRRRDRAPHAALGGRSRLWPVRQREHASRCAKHSSIVSWVEGLGPRNAGAVFLNVLDSGLPRPKVVQAEANFGQWQLGKPNLMRELPANTIEAQRAGVVARTVVDLGLTSERRVRALEYMPGDRRVVRAAFFTLQETGQWLGSWTPWYGFVNLPAGTAYRLPAGSHIVAEIHYRSAKERVVDRGTVGLFFAESPTPNRPSDLVLEAMGEVPGRRQPEEIPGWRRRCRPRPMPWPCGQTCSPA